MEASTSIIDNESGPASKESRTAVGSFDTNLHKRGRKTVLEPIQGTSMSGPSRLHVDLTVYGSLILIQRPIKDMVFDLIGIRQWFTSTPHCTASSLLERYKFVTD